MSTTMHTVYMIGITIFKFNMHASIFSGNITIILNIVLFLCVQSKRKSKLTPCGMWAKRSLSEITLKI